MPYLSLDPQRIVSTMESLERRVGERFPDSGLKRVAGELVGVARKAADRSERIRRPNRLLRAGAAALCAAFVGLVGVVLAHLRLDQEKLSVTDLIQAVDALLESTVFLGATVFFLFSLDNRFKRRRVLQALHELRSLAHIVDMHQLTKDPEFATGKRAVTPSSPQRIQDRFDLARYLDYCSEMLSVVSKVAALYVQGFEDPVALSAVDEVESLTSGLSRKIWQKIMILDRVAGSEA